ncbi:MAG: hypothetical protein K8R21_11520 [Leptospira sp.]|nr:hypothetical protein [Leptospira sp.]
MKFKFVLWIFVFSVISCSGREVRIEVQGASYCLASKIHFQTPLPEDSKVREIMNDPELNERFSPRSIRIAIAYGIWQELLELVRMEKDPKASANAEASVRKIQIENVIYRRLQLASSDIASNASEFGCYVDRFTDNNPLNEAASILGGIVVTYFSYKAYKHIVTIEFKPKSSNLKDLWFNVPTSSNYSSSMWFIFTKPVLKDEPAPRDLLIKRWLDNGFLGTEQKEDRDFHINLFFGTGGISTIDHITDRREMNQEMQTLILLLEQDVKVFRIELAEGARRLN